MEPQGESVAILHGNYQTVVTRVQPDKYSPIIVQKEISVRWIIKAAAKDLNDCNQEIIIPKYNLKKRLAIGDNWVQFTPLEEGVVGYSCWMGMIQSKITVVDDIAKLKSEANR